MKHIRKGCEPPEFTAWKAQANANWQPTYADLSGPVKQAVKNALRREQGWLCCYCEQRLVDPESHIEHLRPQADPKGDALDYGNLLCSCQDRLTKREPRHCGALKGDRAIPVSPLDPACEGRFAYYGDGGIGAKDQSDRDAEDTIKVLGLDIAKLNSLRAATIEPFLKDDLTPGELAAFVTGYLKPDAKGQFQPFWTTIRYLFG